MWIYNCNDQGNDAETTRSPALEISRIIVIIIIIFKPKQKA